MRSERHFTLAAAALTSAVFAVLFLVACQQTQAPGPASPPTKPATTSVLVVFEGPWAIVADPSNPNGILAIAPQTKSHRPLAVVPANEELEPGVYELTVPASPGPPHGKLDTTTFFQTDVDPTGVQSALASKGARYAVRLPRPDGYLAETRQRSRVGGPPYPPSTQEEDYATAFALRYNATTLTGFSLAGTADAGPTFNPLLLQLDAPLVRFEIVPTDHHPYDPCYIHARQAFHDLVGLLHLNLYVDFPKYTEDCHEKDPQVSRSKTTRLIPGLTSEPFDAASLDGFRPLATAGFGAGPLANFVASGLQRINSRLAALYFFTTAGGGCKSPGLIGNGG